MFLNEYFTMGELKTILFSRRNKLRLQKIQNKENEIISSRLKAIY